MFALPFHSISRATVLCLRGIRGKCRTRGLVYGVGRLVFTPYLLIRRGLDNPRLKRKLVIVKRRVAKPPYCSGSLIRNDCPSIGNLLDLRRLIGGLL